MNLIDLIRRKDRCVVAAPEGLEPCVHASGGIRMHALRLEPGAEIRIRDFLSFDELRSLPRDLGWAAHAGGGPLSRPAPANLAIAIRAGESRSASNRERLRRGAGGRLALALAPGGRHRLAPRRVRLARRRPGLRGAGAVDLGFGEGTSHARGQRGARHPRAPPRTRARRGIEIGPGINPQVRPGPDVDVSYLERSPFEEWSKLYVKKGEPLSAEIQALWTRYNRRRRPAARRH